MSELDKIMNQSESIEGESNLPLSALPNRRFQVSVTLTEVNALMGNIQQLNDTMKSMIQAAKPQTVTDELATLERIAASMLRRIQALRLADK